MSNDNCEPCFLGCLMKSGRMGQLPWGDLREEKDINLGKQMEMGSR